LTSAGCFRRLESGVDLLVCLDVTLPPPVPANVRHAVNIYLSRHRLYPADPLCADAGSQTHVENLDLSQPDATMPPRGLHHLNLTASPAVQGLVLDRIFQTLRQSPPL
jgi:hypothetical protein